MEYKLPERLRELREEKGISQLKLGSAVGLTQGYIGNVEAGRKSISVYTLMRIADYFDVSTDYLLGRKEY